VAGVGGGWPLLAVVAARAHLSFARSPVNLGQL
jgi:hypothetical protein